MKKTMRKRMLSILMLVCLLFAICATPASAYTFSFNFPSSDQISSSMRSTSFSYQSKGATPYVSTNVTTISTLYFIYGHHMDNGTMLQNPMGYKEQAFYDRHPTGQLITPDESYTVEFFAGYVVSVENDAWNTSFISGEEFTQWLTAAQERSLFSSAINPAECDRIITLSTCSYEFYNARFVVLGKIS